MSEPAIITRSSRDRIAFGEEAARWFNQHPGCATYTRAGVEHGELFAVRWAGPAGGSVVSVLVFELPYDAVIVGDLDSAPQVSK